MAFIRRIVKQPVAAALAVATVCAMTTTAVPFTASAAAGSMPTRVTVSSDPQTTPGSLVWEWRRLDQASPAQLRRGLIDAHRVGITHIAVDVTYLVDITEIRDPVQRAAADTAYRARVQWYLTVAARYGITVSAAVGTPGWVDDDTRYVPDIITTWLQRIVADPGPGFAGVVIDVEPWGDSRWANPQQRVELLTGWLRFVADMTTGVASAALPVEVAIPSWLDEPTAAPLLTHPDGTREPASVTAARILATGAPGSGLLVMAYRDRALGRGGSARIVRHEFATGDQWGITVTIGQEIAAVAGEPETVTFHQEGPGALRTAMRQLQRRYGDRPSFDGFAVDHAAALTGWADHRPLPPQTFTTR